MRILQKGETMVYYRKATDNTPFPNSKNHHFQNEAKCKSFVMVMSFISLRIKNPFHINGFTVKKKSLGNSEMAYYVKRKA